MNTVEILVEQISKAAAEKNLYLHRYQTNGSNHRVKITYCLHDDEIKPTRSEKCNGGKITLSHLEGKTEKCEAYKKLSTLMEYIR